MELGRPATPQRNKLADVSIAKPRLDPNQMSDAQKSKYMEKLTGFKSVLSYVVPESFNKNAV